jgi:NDP-sugar pyrophosphorylase family protein
MPRAVVMAGGRGSRLAPYTTVLPKPLMPLEDGPILEVILRQLARGGVDEVVISVGHLGALIESWVGQLTDFTADVRLVFEDEPLGTAGALALVGESDGPFLAMNGDILTDLDFAALLAEHRESEAIATVAVNERAVKIEYGVVHHDDDGLLERLEEKPTLRYTVSMGVYAFDPAITGHIRPGERIDFPDLLLRARDAGERVRVHTHDGYWRDIGNRDDYEAATVDYAERRDDFLG